MRVRHIYVWIAGASLLLLLLIIVQVIWLKKASTMEKKEMNIHILRALERVEKQLSHSINCFDGYSKTFIPTNDRFYMVREPINPTGTREKRDTLDIFYDPAGAYPDNAILKEKIAHYKYPVSLEIQLNLRLIMSPNDTFRGFRNDTSQIVNSYRDIITNNLQITDLINTEKADSLIGAALWEEHLSDVAYNFGFISEQDGKVQFTKRIKDTAMLLASPYYVSLFHDNKFARPYKLALVFPILPGIYGITLGLIISIIVIVMFTMAFYAFVRLYIRQARLADMKNDFINNLTHEFNTPMANITLAVETLQGQEVANNPRVHRVLDIITSESLRLRGNIERALQVASMEKGNLKLHKHIVDLVPLLQTVIDGYSLRCEQLGGSISFTHPAQLLFFGDDVHLANSVGNLLDNAIKYKRAEPIITLDLSADNKEILLTITDNGRGINQQSFSHIFDKFYRVDEGNLHNTKGFGLGLNYVKGIIELHGGKIELTSKEGEGTRFFIHLPTINNG